MRTEVPAKIRDDLAAARMTKALAQAGKWIADRGQVLVIEGGTGSGKSVAAAWVAEFVRARGGTVAWCYVPDVSAIAEWKTGEWDRFNRADLLVLDDLGDERDPERAAIMLARVWNTSGARCIVTTNLDKDRAGTRYGERVRSRLAKAAWYTTDEGDMRLKPPTGKSAPDPAAKTKRELAAEKAAEEARAAEEEAELAELRQRSLWADNAIAELAEKTGITRAEHEAEVARRENDARQKFAKQMEHLRELEREEAANE